MDSRATCADVAVGSGDVATLLQKAAGGDHRALEGLQSQLPGADEMLIEIYGDLAHRLHESMIADRAGSDLLEAEGIRLRLSQITSQLAGPNPVPVECVIIERIATAWLHAHLCDLSVAEYRGDLKQKARLFKIQHEADRRLFRACRALTQVQKVMTHSPKNGKIDRRETNNQHQPPPQTTFCSQLSTQQAQQKNGNQSRKSNL